VKAALALVAVLACSACTSYRALTAPPPSRTATLANDNDLCVSEGVGIGFECVTAWGHPCGGPATMDDPGVAKVFPAYLARVESFVNGALPPSSYVVVGVKAGHTVLRIPGEDAIDVVVVP
jgi:hypothetical protein